ncbi:MAG: DNA recombination protein RmuC [Gammaproteobacteria bacterium]|nr:DNA recombination protein RmuC [Gammaproteobacteria bacterium]
MKQIDLLSLAQNLPLELSYILIGFLVLLLFILYLLYKQYSLNSQFKQLFSSYTQSHVQQLTLLDQLKESTAVGFEKNKGDIQQALGEVLNKNQSEFMKQLSDTRFNLLETLAQQNQSQLQNLHEFRDKFSEHINLTVKNNTDSLTKMFNDLRVSNDQHMKEINERVESRLKQGFKETNTIFNDIRERLQQIDHAQQRISELSSNVVSLQKTLDNKSARGAFGEIQLKDIISDMLPKKHYAFQELLSNDKRPDCTVYLPEPTGKLIIDSKFPLENFQKTQQKDISDVEKKNYERLFKQDIKKHIKDICEKYIIPGETADGAVMFIPSEAIFSEIHAYHPDLVQQAQHKRVWLTSPSTLMALLTTIRVIIADDERSRQAKIIHQHLSALSSEFERFRQRMNDLGKHINQANEDVNKIQISSQKITKKFEQIETAEFDKID